MFLNREVLTFLSGVRGWVAMTTAIALAASGLSLAVAFSIAAAVRTLLEPSGTTSALESALPAIALTAVFAALRGACLWLRDQAAMTTAARVKQRLRAQLVDKLHELGPGHRWPAGRGGVQTTVVDGIERLNAYVGFYLPQLLVSWLVPAVVIGVLLALSPPVALLVIACALIVPFAQRLWRAVLRNRADDHWQLYAAYSNRMADTIRGMGTLLALGAAPRRRRHLEAAAEDLRRATTDNMRASLGVSAVMNGAMIVGTAGATLLAALETARGNLDPAGVLLVLFLAAECFRPQQDLSGYWHEGFYGITAAHAVSKVLAIRPAVEEPERPTANPVPDAPDIQINGVSFRYPEADRDALADISIAVPGGSTLAIVGRSGSGKTTLGRLLLRDFDPTSGEIRLGDEDLRDYPLAHLRARTARVAQDVVLLSGTIRENVALAQPDAPAAQIEQAIDDAQVREMQAVLADGLDSQVGETGKLLSGGQRQRIALARALLSDASMLLLDEATSALDAENESLIAQVLQRRRRHLTTVVIAHRLSTVTHADLVLVLDDGRIAEFGPPSELLAQGGHWARLLHEQQAVAVAAGAGR